MACLPKAPKVAMPKTPKTAKLPKPKGVAAVSVAKLPKPRVKKVTFK